MTVRVRFAPAPSGSLHVGNARSALFNWLFARKHGGVFVLRVEDTDPDRAKPEFTVALMDVLAWLGLDWDEGPDRGGPFAPYRQSERFEGYREAAEAMVRDGVAYRCWCSPEELEERRRAQLAAGRPPGYDGRCRTLGDAERSAFEREGRRPAIRFHVPAGTTEFDDLVHGPRTFDHAQIADFVVMRAGGAPTYPLAAACDDLAMQITHVIRGEDLISATPRQMMLFRALGEPDAARWPRYAHLPLIVGADRKPLSKRSGDVSLEHYRDGGFLPEAMVNYLALLGWSPGDGATERFTTEELIRTFTLDGVSRNPAAFDTGKLTALNGEKIRALAPRDLAERLVPYLVRAGVVADPPTVEQRAVLGEVVPLIQERMARLDEASEQIAFLFGEVEPDEKARTQLTDETRPMLRAILDLLGSLEPWTAERIQETLMAWADGAGIKRKVAFQPLRAALAGRLVSPPLFECMEILGRDTTLLRLRAAAG